METAFNYSTPEQKEKLLAGATNEYTSYLPFYRSVGGATAVNFRDGIQKGDTTNTPLQFVYEEADCRLFYTAEMTIDVTAVWKKVYDAKWGNASCVAGTLGDKGAPGGYGKAKTMETATFSLPRELSSTSIDELRVGMDAFTYPDYGRRADGYMLP